MKKEKSTKCLLTIMLLTPTLRSYQSSIVDSLINRLKKYTSSNNSVSAIFRIFVVNFRQANSLRV